MPKPFPQIFPGEDFAGTFEQCRQYLKRLLLEFDPDTLPAQLSREEVGLEDSETDWPRDIR
jgi:hypothetical protein